MVQEGNKRPLSLLNHQRENMRGYSLLFIIITSKGSKQSFKKAENKYSKIHRTGSEGNFSSLCVIIEVYPSPPWTCPIHYIPPPPQFTTSSSSLLCSITLPPIVDIGTMIMMITIAVFPPPLHLQTSREVTVVSTEWRYLYPITLIYTVQDI